MSADIEQTTDNLEEREELPLLTFNALYNILREEKRTKELQKYPPLFYEALENFIKLKKDDLRKENDSLKIKKEENVLKNSIKIAEEIISIRTQKISKIAISNSVHEDILDKTNILDSEIEFFELVTKQTKKLLKKIN